MEIKVCGPRVLVEVEKFERTTKSGIIIPDPIGEAHDLVQDVGTVRQFGPGAFHECGGPESWGVAVGDRILFAKGGGKIVRLPGLAEDYRIINDEDVLATVTEA